MSTVFSPTPASLGLNTTTDTRPVLRSRLDGVRGLSTLLMAAAVAALVVLAERLMGGWAEQHQFLAWVALWLLVTRVGLPPQGAESGQGSSRVLECR